MAGILFLSEFPQGRPAQAGGLQSLITVTILCLLSQCVLAQLSPTLCNPMDCSLPGSSVHGNSPGKITGVGCHFLLQGIFPSQGMNLCLLHLLHWQADSLPLCHLGNWIWQEIFHLSLDVPHPHQMTFPFLLSNLLSYFLPQDLCTWCSLPRMISFSSIPSQLIYLPFTKDFFDKALF